MGNFLTNLVIVQPISLDPFLFQDGTYLDFVPGEIEFECQFVFDFLRNNSG